MISITSKLLTDDEQTVLNANLRQLNAKQPRALLRDAYYDGKRRLAQYGISIPPQMRDLETVVGWPAKTCDVLSSRLRMEGFVTPGQSTVNSELEDIFALNKMSVEVPQAHVSTFINGLAFGAVTPGDASLGEPDVLINTMSATEATGIWDVRRRGLTSAVWVPARGYGEQYRTVIFLPGYTIVMTRDVGKQWSVERFTNPLPRIGVTPLRYRPRMGRPMGMSRISRAVISLTDQAVRTMLRTEVTAEFFSSPQRALLGADETAFQNPDGTVKTGWEAIIGRVWAIPRDDKGELPTIQQMPQASMEPHNAQLRSIAMMFAGETAIPPSNLGIIHDNPASAEAIDAAWADMVGVAEQCQTELGSSWVEIGQNALMLANGETSLPDSLVRLRSKWRDASIGSRQAQTAATVAQIQAGVLRPDSAVALEQLGYDQTDIDRIQAEHAQAAASNPIAGLTGLLNQQAVSEPQ